MLLAPSTKLAHWMQVLKDATLTMYAAGLVPAAHVHFGCKSAPEGQLLREDVLQQLGPAAARQVRSQVRADEATRGAASGAASSELGSGVPRQGASQASGQAKKPKWLKIGK